MKFDSPSSIPRIDPARLGASFDADAVSETIRRALASAGLDTQSGPMRGVTDTIRQALATGGAKLQQQAGTAFPAARGAVIDVVARVVGGTVPGPVGDATPAAIPVGPVRPGEFATRSFTNRAGTRFYKLYVPSSYAADVGVGDRVPLVVMLHGCTQNPDDFAAGTRMNELADRHGFLVAYPAQAANANGSKCWNWFKAEDQGRDAGEPSLIAGITREVARSYRVDERCIFVAGLSAGAAMAVILGRTHPELYAGVGAHSGLPYAAAHDLPSAFAAMKGGAAGPLAGLAPQRPGAAPRPQPAHRVPTIVFHGDQDATVSPGNGEAIALQALAAAVAQAPSLTASVQQGAVPGGRSWRREVHADAAGRPVVEQWLLHGAGHAWSGGSASGSYTDASGPDASAEMVRFFLAQQPAGTA